ncbi:YopJ family acetyltransferase [Rhizobacter sp. Root1221]|uniref:YopJ family acetyltransferase n=1 Tax=Rhizobacter sp. Root1221 TaxID=1736433 RepID=UPI000701EB99|nr:YopJ family acetyltransferase [Rhizobacter sp. Root1221]KQW01218.1 hypothetical protein ASC87_15110 [Rhizobacter sp. Root1221]
MLNIRTSPPTSKPASPQETPNRAADPGSGSRASHADSLAHVLPARRATSPVTTRAGDPSPAQTRPARQPLPPTTTQPPTFTSAGQHLGIAHRLQEMKGYLAELRLMHAAGRELPRSRDTQFLDLLVVMENARNASLRLSAQAIDHEALDKGDAAAMKAVAGLARAAIEGMGQGSWHAVLSVDGHEVAVAAEHDEKHPARLSLIVVDSASSLLSSGQWRQIARLVGQHMNRALADEGKPTDAQVWVSCLSTSTEVTATCGGSTIFSLAAAREMPHDPDIQKLHKDVLGQAAEDSVSATARLTADNHLLGARFFKHMTHPGALQDLLKRRPELEDAPVNKKGTTLRQHQAEHVVSHRPPFGVSYAYSDSFERKRLRMYERAIAHLEPVVMAEQLQGMEAYVHELGRAAKGEAPQPTPRDAEFMGLLIDVENTLDPQLRLSAHRVDPVQLAALDPAAINDLWQSVATGVRSGADWHATLDLGGHHAALSARHDPDNHAHVSLVVVDGTGSPLLREGGGEGLTKLLGDRLQAMLRGTGHAGQGKVRLTHFDVSARQPDIDNALFAVLSAKNLKDFRDIGEAHAEALKAASSSDEPTAVDRRDGAHLIDPDYGVSDQDEPIEPEDLKAELDQEQIEMYQRAISHFEHSPRLDPVGVAPVRR